jgi:hypothetical protein
MHPEIGKEGPRLLGFFFFFFQSTDPLSQSRVQTLSRICLGQRVQAVSILPKALMQMKLATIRNQTWLPLQQFLDDPSDPT